MNQFNESEITIILPPHLPDIPIRVVRTSVTDAGVVVQHEVQPARDVRPHIPDQVLVRYKDAYTKLAMDDILWIEADRSYSIIHTKDGQTFTNSFSLASVERSLPDKPLLRIHRSYMVNTRHVTGMTGNCLMIGDQEFVVGREYRQKVKDYFVYIGVRKAPKKVL